MHAVQRATHFCLNLSLLNINRKIFCIHLFTFKINLHVTKLLWLKWQWAPSKDVSGEYMVRFSGRAVFGYWACLLLMRWINRSHLVSRKPVREKKKINSPFDISSSEHRERMHTRKMCTTNLGCHESHDHPQRESFMHLPTQIVK
jgi:hypothetical protein